MKVKELIYVLGKMEAEAEVRVCYNGDNVFEGKENIDSVMSIYYPHIAEGCESEVIILHE